MGEPKFDIQLTNAPGDKIAIDLGVTSERSDQLNKVISHNLALRISSGEGTVTTAMKAIVRECGTLEEVVWSIFAMTKAMDVYDAILGRAGSINTSVIAKQMAVKKTVGLKDLKEEWERKEKDGVKKSSKKAEEIAVKPHIVTPTTGEPFKIYVDTSIEDFYGAFGITKERGKELDQYVKDYFRWTKDEGKVDLRYAFEEILNTNSLNKQEAIVVAYTVGQILGRVMEAGYAHGGEF